MSQGNNQDYVANELRIERPKIKRVSISAEGNQLEEPSANEMYVVVKDEIEDDVDSDGGEYYILADDMEMVEMSDGLPYLRATFSAEDPNSEDGSHFILVDAASESNEFASSVNNSQAAKSDNKSPLYIDLFASKQKYKSKTHKKRSGFSERFNLKNPSSLTSFGNKKHNYGSEVLIYSMQNDIQNTEGNTGSVSRKFKKIKGNERSFQVSDYNELLKIPKSGKLITTSEQQNETHPFKCGECGECFELKSHFEMHELGHEKYKFYSFKTNTVRCICAQCKKPFLYSADEKVLNSNMCVPCVLKLRERMTLLNADKAKESETKRQFEFPEISNPPKVGTRKQCYSCGRRSDRYFVYGASLLCAQCWQNRIHRSKRICTNLHTPFQLERGSYRRHKYVETCATTSQDAEENSNLVGTHFLLSTFDATDGTRVEEKDDDYQEIQEDWRETETPKCEDESDSNTVALCDKTGKFIDINCCV